MTTEELAREVLRVLALQRVYFRTRTQEALAESKEAERQLKITCEGIANPPVPTLFN